MKKKLILSLLSLSDSMMLLLQIHRINKENFYWHHLNLLCIIKKDFFNEKRINSIHYSCFVLLIFMSDHFTRKKKCSNLHVNWVSWNEFFIISFWIIDRDGCWVSSFWGVFLFTKLINFMCKFDCFWMLCLWKIWFYMDSLSFLDL